MKNAAILLEPIPSTEIKYPLSGLLPYDLAVKKDDRLEAGLREYLLVLTATQEAMVQLGLGNLKHFDPLVGENSCQIRAIKLALLVLNCAFDIPKLLDEVQEAKSKIKYALANLHKIDKKNTSLKYFIENESCEISLSKEENFLIASFILTRTKVLKEATITRPLIKNEMTDTKKIKEFGPVGSMFADNFVAHLRRQVSASSVNFVQNISNDLCPKKWNAKMVWEEFLVSHKGLQCIPCYWSTRIAIEYAHRNRIPIVMQAYLTTKEQNYKTLDKTTIYFECTADGYEPTTRCKLNLEVPALILSGTTCRSSDKLPTKENWINELVEYCPTELVMAYAAAHRQYPDASKDQQFLTIDDKEYHEHKNKASEWGCSLENPSLFFLAHAYCDKIKNLEHA